MAKTNKTGAARKGGRFFGSNPAMQSFTSLLEVAKDEMGKSKRPRTMNVAVYYDRSCSSELTDYAKEALKPMNRTIFMHEETYFDECCEVDAAADLTIIFAADSPWTGATAAISKEKGVPTVVVTENLAATYDLAAKTGFELDAADFISPELANMEGAFMVRLWNAVADDRFKVARPTGHALLFYALGEWISKHMGEGRYTLSAAFPFVRRPLAGELASRCAYQNGAIALAVFLPGADMPLMMANQARLVIQIGNAYGYPMDRQTLIEMGAVGASAFGLRGAARKLSSAIPGFGVAAKIGVAYTGTLAMGYAAIQYCEHDKDIEVVDRVKDWASDIGEKIGTEESSEQITSKLREMLVNSASSISKVRENSDNARARWAVENSRGRAASASAVPIAVEG